MVAHRKREPYEVWCLGCGNSLGILEPRRAGKKRRCKECSDEAHRAREYLRRRSSRTSEQNAALDEYRQLKAVGLKRCTKCKEVLPLSEFNKSGGAGGRLRGACRLCQQTIESSRARVSKRDYHLNRLYSLSLTDYDAMLNAQGGKCAACGELPSEVLYVDHDHSSGTVRGLLCRHCNTAIGYAMDSPERLRKLAQYLEVSIATSRI